MTVNSLFLAVFSSGISSSTLVSARNPFAMTYTSDEVGRDASGEWTFTTLKRLSSSFRRSLNISP